MLFLFICTEGDSSEPKYVETLKRKCGGQAPNTKDTHLKIVTLSLGGNQGHRGIFDKANEAINKYIHENSDGNEDIFLGNGNRQEKWLICDFDNMSERGIDEASLRAEATSRGFRLIINKPNFEFFVLLHLYINSEARSFKPREYEEKINEAIKEINDNNKAQLGNNADFYIIPKYTKRKTAAELFFDRLLEYGPVSLEEISYRCSNSTDTEKYSNMGELIKRITSLYSN